MVWKREEHPEEKLEQPPNSQIKTRIPAKLTKVERLKRLTELRQKIEEAERKVRQKKLHDDEVQENEEKKIEEEKRVKEDRRKKFEASFAEAFESARKQFAEDLATRKTPIVFASELEINRILSAKSDYAVLQLTPGATSSELRKRYREMCLSTHPDKNGHSKAQDAFRKIVASYKSLSKYIV